MKYFKVIAIGIVSVSGLMAMAPVRSLVGVIKMLPMSARPLSVAIKYDLVCKDCKCAEKCEMVKVGNGLVANKNDMFGKASMLLAISYCSESDRIRALGFEASSLLFGLHDETEQDVTRLKDFMKEDTQEEKKALCAALRKKLEKRVTRLTEISDELKKQ